MDVRRPALADGARDPGRRRNTGDFVVRVSGRQTTNVVLRGLQKQRAWEGQKVPRFSSAERSVLGGRGAHAMARAARQTRRSMSNSVAGAQAMDGRRCGGGGRARGESTRADERVGVR